MSAPLHRRVRGWSRITLTLLATVAPVAAAQPPAPRGSEIVIGYLDASGDTVAERSFRRGVDLGLSEAARAADLLGRRIRLIEAGNAPTAREAAISLQGGGASAVITRIVDEAALEDLGRWSAATAIPIIVVGSDRPSQCDAVVFRIARPPGIAPATLLPATTAGVTEPGGEDRAPVNLELAFWHPSLERFGAAQLSDRFRARYSLAMDSDAWAGWMAVKIVWESSLRADTGGPGLRDAIARGGFDGHKGKPLRFGADRILQQPMLIVGRSASGASAPDTVLAEVPWPVIPPPNRAPRDSMTARACAPGAP